MNTEATSTLPAPLREEDDEINLGEILATLLEYKWLIAFITLGSFLLGLAYVTVATPIYQARALLQWDDSMSSKGGALGALKDVMGLFAATSSTATQTEILNSRMILGPVVEKFKLDLQAEPRYFPLLGKVLAKRYQGPGFATPWFDLSDYAWGGEAIQVESLEVPPALISTKVNPIQLTLVADKDEGYRLLDPEGNTLLRGRVGEPAVGDGIHLFVSRLQARPGTQFILSKRSLAGVIDDLQNKYKYTIKERSKDSGMLDVSLTYPDPVLLPKIVDEITQVYLRQNVEYRSTEADKTLKFLEAQLPALKTQMDNASNAFKAYRQRVGSAELSLETQGVLSSIVDVDKQIVLLQQQRDELQQQFTPEHPRMQTMDSQIARLKEKKALLEGKVKSLPATQQEVLQLQLNMELYTKLYTDLLNNAQQLRISKAGTVGEARIVDPAILDDQPVWPKTPLILAVALLLGLLFSLMVVWVIRSLRVTVDDPEKIENALGIPVYATIPHSKIEETLAHEVKRGKRKTALLSVDFPEENAVESLRSLRTTIHFALLDAAKNSLLITGPAPEIGKSFVSKNLGVVLAQADKRVAIIDADLRRGHIHREFNLPREKGISEYVSGTATLSEIVKPTLVPGLSVVTTGQRSPNPSELLMHPHFEELLTQLGDLFDILIVDAPPILAVSDAAIIGRHTGAILMVARAGRHPLGEISQAVKRLTQTGLQIKGFVFNDMDTVRQQYRYGYHGYVYQYAYKKAS